MSQRRNPLTRGARRLRWLLRIYPPLAGAGVKVTEITEDFSRIRVRMKLHWWNRNAVGTHYGGSLYSMCDPFFMFILMEKLGSEFIVWDKKAKIHFRRPGRGTVHAEFHISDEEVAEIRCQAQQQEAVESWFQVNVQDGSGEVIATVEKLLYVRRKDRSSKSSA